MWLVLSVLNESALDDVVGLSVGLPRVGSVLNDWDDKTDQISPAWLTSVVLASAEQGSLRIDSRHLTVLIALHPIHCAVPRPLRGAVATCSATQQSC